MTMFIELTAEKKDYPTLYASLLPVFPLQQAARFALFPCGLCYDGSIA
jgi:hypothetical protein